MIISVSFWSVWPFDVPMFSLGSLAWRVFNITPTNFQLGIICAEHLSKKRPFKYIGHGQRGRKLDQIRMNTFLWRLGLMESGGQPGAERPSYAGSASDSLTWIKSIPRQLSSRLAVLANPAAVAWLRLSSCLCFLYNLNLDTHLPKVGTSFYFSPQFSEYPWSLCLKHSPSVSTRVCRRTFIMLCLLRLSLIVRRIMKERAKERKKNVKRSSVPKATYWDPFKMFSFSALHQLNERHSCPLNPEYLMKQKNQQLTNR